MADLSDVESGIANLLGALVYPATTAQPSAVSNGNGGFAPVKIVRGWPGSAALDADLAQGVANLSVYSRGVTELNTTRYPVDYQEVSRQAATITATAQGNTVEIVGGFDPNTTQFVTLQIGPRFTVSYAPVSGDTAASIAATLASLINAGFAPASASGGLITVTSGSPIRAVVGTQGSQLAEVERQRIQIQITLWCGSPIVRDNLAKLIVPALALQTFIIMPDTSACRFRYNNTVVTDTAEKSQLYRRDLIYTAEYATTLSDTAYHITDVSVSVQGALVFGIGKPVGAPSVASNIPAPKNPAPVSARVPFAPIVPN